MLETFLILLAGGVLLAAAISDPKQVTIHWLRLAGILALSFAAIATFFAVWRGELQPVTIAIVAVALLCICAQLAFVQVAARNVQRAFAFAAFVIACVAVVALAPRQSVWMAISCAGIAAACGIALMDMLLGHAYLTAAKMGIAPFRRINLALVVALALRAICAGPIVYLLNARQPVDRLLGIFGLYIATRWFVGLIIPALFVYMAHDCIKRRSTQSATGILYVAGVFILICVL